MRLRARAPSLRHCHELGHLLLQQSSQLALCTEKDLIPFYTNSPDELEASAFAAALLMPQNVRTALEVGEAFAHILGN